MQTSFTELPNSVTNHGSDWRKAVKRATVNFRDIQYQIFSIGGYIQAQLQSSQSSVPLLQNFGYIQFEICVYMPSSDILCSQHVLAVLIFLSLPPPPPPPPPHPPLWYVQIVVDFCSILSLDISCIQFV